MKSLSWSKTILLTLTTFVAIWNSYPAHAHDVWANGKAVPKWVKESCCGVADVHHLQPGQIHRLDNCWPGNKNGCYRVDGYDAPIPIEKAQPSQDGDYWIFYRDNVGGGQSSVYCFFVPMYF